MRGNGIILLPKWDENQSSYRTFCSGNLIGVHVTASKPENTGLIFEALAAETYKTIVPAYFGTALKEKFTYDSESGQMLDIINDSLTVSFAYVYDNWQGFGYSPETLPQRITHHFTPDANAARKAPLVRRFAPTKTAKVDSYAKISILSCQTPENVI